MKLSVHMTYIKAIGTVAFVFILGLLYLILYLLLHR